MEEKKEEALPEQNIPEQNAASDDVLPEQEFESEDDLPKEDNADKLLDESVKKTTVRNTVIAAVILVLAFLFILNINKITGFFIKEKLSEPEDYYYKGMYHFYKGGSLWTTELVFGNQVIKIPLHFSPKDLENITIEGEVDERFRNSSRLYITFDPGEKLGFIALAVSELTLNLAQGMNIGLIAACTTNSTEECYHRPIITCNNTDKGAIYLRDDNEPRVIMSGNCITIQGRNYDLVRAADRLLLKWYRVMD